MIETALELLKTLNGMSPLAIVGLALLVVYHLIGQKKSIKKVTDNHLEHIQGDIAEIKKTSESHTQLLTEMRDGINKLVDRTR